MRQPVRDPRSGLWLARYTAPDGRVLQAGRFERKRDAQKAIAVALGEGDRRAAHSLVTFFEEWPERFPGHPRTMSTNQERIERYILPYLPHKGHLPITDLRKSALRDVQARLLEKGLSKETIDGAFSSLSAMLRDAYEEEYVDENVARGLRVRNNDPRLNPAKPKRERRAVTVEEVAAFIKHVPPRYLSLCWTPFLTGCRPGELFALVRTDVDREVNMVMVHQTVDRYGHLQAGTKTTHHVRAKEARGRWTLFPRSLVTMIEGDTVNIDGWLYPSPRGHLWGQRNFYRNVWEPAQQASGTSFTLYDARHTFSSRLLAAGVPLVDISAWMGHSLRAGGAQMNTTTRTYAHSTGESRTTALAELETFVRRANRISKQRKVS